MWDGFFMLLSFSTVMGLASFLAGSLPLSFGLSQNHSRLISAIGTGLLVGTCLIVIIPEGVETLYDSNSHVHHRRQESALDSGPIEELQHRDPHAWVGLALVTGFIMMYLIDQLPRHAASVAGNKQPLHISLANLAQGPHRAAPEEEEEDGAEVVQSTRPVSSFATTIGLVIHAAADGIALAASSFISESSTGFVVFLALMVHKAPAAFGLTSVLLKQGLTKRQTRAHLTVFSLASPIGALVTWTLVNVVTGGHLQGEQGTKFATGLLLLFSGGTFLYVAMHTMQETAADEHEDTSNGYGESHSYPSGRIIRQKDKKIAFRDTLLVVAGMLLPLLAQVGHAH